MAPAVQGMDIGRSELVLHVRVCEGLMRQLDGTVEKRFAKKEILYPLQVFHLPLPAPLLFRTLGIQHP